MKLFKKKYAALFLTAILITTALSACGKDKDSSQNTVSSESLSSDASTLDDISKETTENAVASSEESETPETSVPETAPEKLLSAYTSPFITLSESLNIREEPSTEADIIGRLVQYAGGEVLETVANGEWLHILSGTVEGYVFASNTAMGEAAEAQAAGHVVDTAIVTAEAANIRDAASTDSNVIDSAIKGTSFEVLAESGDFYQIQTANGSAFISKSIVSPVQMLRTATPVEPVSSENTSDGNSSSGNAPSSPSGSYTAGSNGFTVCIDAGHQQAGIPEKEPNGPGSSVMKAKLTTGTSGCVTGNTEYQVNLDVSLKLQAELSARGYNVVMIRTTNDCPLSNAERAQVANASGAQIFVRVHCNSLDNSAVTGVINYAPSAANPYLSSDLVSKSNNLAALLADRMCAKTGAQNRGVLQDDGMTGINWCTIPVSIVEMGFMSNPTEDQLLGDPAYQTKLAQGMADGIDAYFGR